MFQGYSSGVSLIHALLLVLVDSTEHPYCTNPILVFFVGGRIATFLGTLLSRKTFLEVTTSSNSMVR